MIAPPKMLGDCPDDRVMSLVEYVVAHPVKT